MGPDPAIVYVDLSNVLRDQSLADSLNQAAWLRWDRLRPAATRLLGRDTSFVLVADSNLRSKLSRSDQAKFDQGRRSGGILVDVRADALMLRQAINASGYVLSNDRFTDYMKMDGITGIELLRWSVAEGQVRVRTEKPQIPHSVRITERQEKEERKQHWADTEVVQHRWRCTNPACRQDEVLVPNMREGSAQCPQCGSYLEKTGKWQQAVQVKVLRGAQETRRITLEDGETVILGRDTDTGSTDVTEGLPPDEARKISRRHLRLRNRNGVIFAEDMGSTNGSSLLVPADRGLWRRIWQPPRRLEPSTEARLARGHRVRLGDTSVIVEISGRRFGKSAGR